MVFFYWVAHTSCIYIYTIPLFRGLLTFLILRKLYPYIQVLALDAQASIIASYLVL
jgi:hypothetical protein